LKLIWGNSRDIFCSVLSGRAEDGRQNGWGRKIEGREKGGRDEDEDEDEDESEEESEEEGLSLTEEEERERETRRAGRHRRRVDKKGMAMKNQPAEFSRSS